MTEQTTTEAQQTFTPTPKNLAEALAKAQGAFSTVQKRNVNEFDNFLYAKLADYLEMVRKPLSENGISYTQDVETSEKAVTVVTTLFHGASGEQRVSKPITLPVTKPNGSQTGLNAQDFGACIEYAKKYSLAAAVVAAAADAPDVDQHQAREPGNNKRRAQGADAGARPTPARQERARSAQQRAQNREPSVWQRLLAEAKKEGLEPLKLAELAKRVTKRTTVTSGLTEADFKAVVEAIAEAKKSEAA